MTQSAHPASGQSWTHAPKLGDRLDPQHNSFGVLRLAMALLVLVSHSYWLATGSNSNEPLHGITGFSLGEHAVQVFFLLSGLLVASAAERSASIRDFATGRILRIFPGLLVCLALTAFVLGPLVTSLPLASYVAHDGLREYLMKTATLLSASVPLPGVFETVPVEGLANGSLWTLKFEVACYAGLAVMLALGLFRPRARTLASVLVAAAILASAAYLPAGSGKYSSIQNIAYFAIHFGLGVLAFLQKGRLRISGIAAAALFVPAALAIGTPLQNLTTAVFLGYGALWLSTQRFGALRTFCNRTDLSYGTYIYAMPVQQTIEWAAPGIGATALTLVALGPVLALAWLSWTLVERPAMGLRGALGRAGWPMPGHAALIAAATSNRRLTT